MAFTNSPLVSYTKISPNRTKNRNHAIDTITIHCVVGQLSVETIGSIFAPASRKASSNYGVGVDGRIGMYVEEKDRSWCSSNSANDNRAITIEVACDKTHPYAVNEKAYAALIDLCVDICQRNGIKKLVWSTSKNDRVNHLNGCNMTVHRDYANKSCPGQYLYDRHGEIADAVNARLGNAEEDAPIVKPGKVAVGDIVTFNGTKHYASANSTKPVPCRPGKATVTKIYHPESSKHPYHLVRVSGGASNVYGWVDAADIWELGESQSEPESTETFSVGDIVEFIGNTHYTNANAANGKSCKGGKAKITQIYQLGKSKHPYHLVRVGGDGATVWGWVDANQVRAAEEDAAPEAATGWDEIIHYKRDDFKCKCGRYCNGFPAEVKLTTVKIADLIAKQLGKRPPVNSGLRCKQHNANTPGAAANSNHMDGSAIDLGTPSGVTPAEMAAVAEKIMGNTGGIGIYSWGIHIDDRKVKARWNG